MKTGQRQFSAALKEKMQQFIAEKQTELKTFQKEYGQTSLGSVTVGQVIGGMRGIPGMLYEPSKLHPLDGIEYRGYDLFRVRELSPKAVPGGQPLPEAVLWLLLTGEFPTDAQTKEFTEELYQRGSLTAEQEKLIKSLPKTMHPMTQLSAGVLMCQPESKFVKAY